MQTNQEPSLSDHFQPLPSKPAVDNVSQPKAKIRPPSPSMRGRMTPTKELDKGNGGKGDVRSEIEIVAVFFLWIKSISFFVFILDL